MNLPPTFPLSMAAEHTPVRVVSIKGTPDFAKRIAEMGLNPGAEISVCQRSGSGLLVSRSGTRWPWAAAWRTAFWYAPFNNSLKTHFQTASMPLNKKAV